MCLGSLAQYEIFAVGEKPNWHKIRVSLYLVYSI